MLTLQLHFLLQPNWVINAVRFYFANPEQTRMVVVHQTSKSNSSVKFMKAVVILVHLLAKKYIHGGHPLSGLRECETQAEV